MLCQVQNDLFDAIEITDSHLVYFKQDLQLVPYGHYLTGVYTTEKNEMVYTSIYEGNKTDSILKALAPSLSEKKTFGEELYWFSTEGKVYLASKKNLVIIDFPPGISEIIIPKNGQSEFFQLCD